MGLKIPKTNKFDGVVEFQQLYISSANTLSPYLGRFEVLHLMQQTYKSHEEVQTFHFLYTSQAWTLSN